MPSDPNDDAANQPPYYVLASPPTGRARAPQFQLTSPMKVNGRQNLAAYMSVDSDPGPDYGKITVLRLPSRPRSTGRNRSRTSSTATPVISKDITLFSGGGSTVVHGNLLTLPIGNSFLYVEPLYVKATPGPAVSRCWRGCWSCTATRSATRNDLSDAL